MDEAISLLKEAASLCRQGEDREGEMIVLGNLGNVYFAQDQMEPAADCYRQVLDLARTAGQPAMVGMGELNLGNVLRAQGRLDEALEHYQRALQFARDAADPDLQSDCWEKLRDSYQDRAARYRQTGHEEEAVADLRQVINIGQGLQPTDAWQKLDVGKAYLEQNNPPGGEGLPDGRPGHGSSPG